MKKDFDMPKIKMVSKLEKNGFPTASPRYRSAHEAADRAEKKADPKAYAVLKKIDARLGDKTLIGKNTKSGKIEVSKSAINKATKSELKKVSKKRLVKNVELHEVDENKKLRKK